MSQADSSPAPSHNHFTPLPLPDGITESYVHCTANGLTFHVLEAGYDADSQKPLLVLLHGFPELAYSWRKVMVPLAEAGYYIVAYDQRGYGRTTGWDDSTYAKTNLDEFSMTNLVRDAVVLVHALGRTSVSCIIGHDFGGVAASMCALMRPDFFKSVVIMSHPFSGAPTLPLDTAHSSAAPAGSEKESTSFDPKKGHLHSQLARLPEPRKHYKWYNSTAVAAFQWSVPLQGVTDFLRGYIHVKSAAYAPNKPHPLTSWAPSELAKLPYYYLMPLHKSMPETISQMMASEDARATESWLLPAELAIYADEFTRTGFQGGLNWYRVVTGENRMRDLDLFAGAKIRCPAVFVSGEHDWGNYQEPGVLERMEAQCADWRGVRLVQGAGHWVQQERPDDVVQELLRFLKEVGA